VSVSAPTISATLVPGVVQAELNVRIANPSPQSLAVSPSQFALSADADMFGAQAWRSGTAPVVIAPGRSHVFRLTFRLPSTELLRATLFYRSTQYGGSAIFRLYRPPAFFGPSATTTTQPTINTFWVSQGVGEPWGTAIDASGDVWFAEPGCDFAPTCAPSTPPGQIGELKASSHAVSFYTLPNLPGNQPIFLAFDGSGNLWFTTPNNSKMGEFNPSTGKFVGQWNLTAGSGPWDLTFAAGKIWYTEHLVAAVGAFDPAAHTHRDFKTPSANSNPYGIAANGSLIWFTENNSTVDRVAVLDPSKKNPISEYLITQPLSGTPHMIAIGASGHPWWTEGFSNTIATLNPAVASPGRCGPTSGTCNGVQRFKLPASTSCSTGTHTSGIAFESSANLVWLDNSLTAQVGSFNPSSNAFALYTLSNCNAHPHDGLTLDGARDVWFDEEFGSAIGELVP
jgi:streptogramin lyase